MLGLPALFICPFHATAKPLVPLGKVLTDGNATGKAIIAAKVAKIEMPTRFRIGITLSLNSK
jgi:hypothetical protein